MTTRKPSKGVRKLEPMGIPTIYQCHRHPTVKVTLHVLGIASCAHCGRPLKRIGLATPEQPVLFSEAGL